MATAANLGLKDKATFFVFTSPLYEGHNVFIFPSMLLYQGLYIVGRVVFSNGTILGYIEYNLLF